MVSLPGTRPLHPARHANCLSSALFCWLGRLLKQGRSQLNPGHVYQVLPEYSSSHLADQLAREWEKELYRMRSGEKPSLLRALRTLFAHHVTVVGVIFFLVESCRVSQVLFISLLIPFFEDDPDVTSSQVYLYATCYVLSYLLGTALDNLGFHKNYCYGMQMRVAATSLIYRKLLKLNHRSIQEVNSGSITNLIAADTYGFEQGCLSVSYVWIPCVEGAVVIWLLWSYLQLGVYALVALAAVALLIPIQYACGRHLTRLRVRLRPVTERRLRILSEVFRGIKTIKTNCWESAFGTMLNAIRSTECTYLASLSHIRTFSSSLHFAWGKLVTLPLFVVLHFARHNVSLASVLASLALLDVLRASAGLLLPWALHYAAQAQSAIDRIQDFLVLEERSIVEIQPQHNPSPPPDVTTPPPNGVALQMTNFSASWMEEDYEPRTLTDISLCITRGQLVAVVGPPSSGKSSLLLSITGELQKLSGFIHAQGKLGYVSQKPWLFPGTIQDNILFGAAWNKRQYRKVLTSCALLKDLETLPFGDATEMDEEELTSTQKAKIVLARSFYQNADIYLLDDILSLMDNASASEIFTRCFCNLLKGKTVLLVTKHLSFIQASDLIIHLQKGSVHHICTYEDTQDLHTEVIRPYEDQCYEVVCGMIHTLAANRNEGRVIRQKLALASHYALEQADQGDYSLHIQSTHGRGSPITPKLYTRRSMGWLVYWHYMRAGAGSCGLLLLALIIPLVQVLFILTDYLLITWVTYPTNTTIIPSNITYDQTTESGLTFPVSSNVTDKSMYLYAYLGTLTLHLLLSLLMALVFSKAAGRARGLQHKQVLDALLHTPLYLINSITPACVTERFAQDMTFTDSALPFLLYDCLQFGSLALGTIILCVLADYWLILFVLPALICLLAMSGHVVQTSTQLKALEDSARTAIYQHVTNSLEGISTLRAFSNEDTYHRQFDSLLDQHTSVRYLLLSSTRWLALRLDGFGGLLLAMLTYTAIAARNGLLGDLVILGLALVYVVNLMSYTQYTIRQATELHSQISGVEQLLQYKYLPGEAGPSEDLTSPSWPQYGIVTLEGCSVCSGSVRHLRNIWCCFRAEEKVGVLSSREDSKRALVETLLRLVPYKGTMRVDGIDTTTVALHKLRGKVAVVSQDPVVFGGSVRRNLDPFTQYTDALIWKALDTVQLSRKIRKLPGGLYTEMVAYGDSLGTGDKQLLELARAILKSPRLLLYEESLSTLDSRTEATIKHVLRTNFRHCTMIILAQHIRTVIDADRVMLLEDGKMKELDPPYVLLNNSSSIFHRLVQSLPEPLRSSLVQAATDKYENRPYVPPAQSLGGQLAMPYPTGNTRHFLPLFQLSHISGTPTRFTGNRLSANRF